MQEPLNLPGRIASWHFLQLFPHKEFQKMVLKSFEDIQKISIFCFMQKGVAQNLSLPHPFEIWNINANKSANFKARDFSSQI